LNKWDGTGYPRRLKGEQIQGKRILFLNREATVIKVKGLISFD